MKSFLFGAFGALMVVAVAAVVVPLYSDYSDRAVTIQMLLSLKGVQNEIEKFVREGEPVPKGLENIRPFPSEHIGKITISSNGMLVVQGHKTGQIVVLVPTINGNNIEWTCLGGSYDAMPPNCRAK